MPGPERSVVWRVVAASVTGSAHAGSDAPCQDAHAWQERPDGTLIVAVADGAGSAPRAAAGAEMAVRAGVAALDAALASRMPADEAGWDSVLRAAMHAARAALAALAEDTGAPLREFHTTLTCLVGGEDWLAVAQNGDGAVVVEEPDGSLHTVARPARGEYANEVAFLTAEDGLEQVVVAVERRPMSALAVTTDGLVRLALQLPQYAPHAPFFAPLLDFARALPAPADADLASFLGSAPVLARTDDDKTLVLAVRLAPGAPAVPVPPPADVAD